MKWRIVTFGKPALRYAQLGVDEYLKRLRKYAKVEIRQLRTVPEPKATALQEEASRGCLRIVLDERGRRDLDTEAFARWVTEREMDGAHREVALMIGASDGHSQATRDSADLLLSLSPFTLQHELALVVALEQLYRVYSLKARSPYHRP